jgi:hypothetical protein
MLEIKAKICPPRAASTRGNGFEAELGLRLSQASRLNEAAACSDIDTSERYHIAQPLYCCNIVLSGGKVNICFLPHQAQLCGIRKIGGITIAQAPDTARHPDGINSFPVLLAEHIRIFQLVHSFTT